MRSRLIGGVLGLGAVAFALSQGFGQFHDQMAKAVTALGGEASALPAIHVKSLRHTYDDVLARITKLGVQAGVVSPPVKPLDYSAMNRSVDLLSAPAASGQMIDATPAIALSRHPIDRTQMMGDYARNPEATRNGPPR